ncbi:hypothetical protein EOT10_18350 [Streptomyces antnestii]|uniref:Uncharacterized protein n=1 Tax=Streptomyces antnestii TaxID=2494256 RepID=A0A437PL72_9ACTN|nr:hypothetical protein [Streptomyces sp. San01]RVU23032.1 hypothetical protein EOT10_18350 [Streptomyces sp. San01]
MDGRTVPWRDRDVMTVCGTSLAGLALLVTSWFGASAEVSTARQAAWLNLGVAGFAVCAGGFCLWLLRARRTLGERRVALIALAPADDEDTSAGDTYAGDTSARDTHAHTTRTPRPGPADDTLALPLVRAQGMDRVHHPDCPLVAGKDVTPAAPGAGEPCGVCAP